MTVMIHIADGKRQTIRIGFLFALGRDTFGHKVGEQSGFAGVLQLQGDGRGCLVKQSLRPDIPGGGNLLRLATQSIRKIHRTGHLVFLHIIRKGHQAECRGLRAQPIVGCERLRDFICQESRFLTAIEQTERHQAD